MEKGKETEIPRAELWASGEGILGTCASLEGKVSLPKGEIRKIKYSRKLMGSEEAGNRIVCKRDLAPRQRISTKPIGGKNYCSRCVRNKTQSGVRLKRKQADKRREREHARCGIDSKQGLGDERRKGRRESAGKKKKESNGKDKTVRKKKRGKGQVKKTIDAGDCKERRGGDVKKGRQEMYIDDIGVRT